MSRRTARARILAAALALLAQAPWVVLLTWRMDARAPEAAPAWIALLPLAPATAIRPAREPDRLPPPALPGAPRVPASPVAVAPITLPPVPVQPASPTPHPPEWRDSLQDAARDLVAREAASASQGTRLDSRPDVMELPPRRPEPPPRVERRDNGDLVVRSGSVECVSPQLALGEHFDVWARNRPARCRRLRRESPMDVPELRTPDYLQVTPAEPE